MRLALISLLSVAKIFTPLYALLNDQDWQIREAAILPLASLGEKLAPEQQQSLSATLYDEHAFVRQAAIIATLKWWPVDNVLEILKFPTTPEKQQINAVRVLGQWPEPDAKISADLRQLGCDRKAHSSVRIAALEALAQRATTFPEEEIGEVYYKLFQSEPDAAVKSAAVSLHDILTLSSESEETTRATGTGDIFPHTRMSDDQTGRKG